MLRVTCPGGNSNFPLKAEPKPPCPVIDSSLKLLVAVASSRYVKHWVCLLGSCCCVPESSEALARLATQKPNLKKNNTHRHTIRVCVTCYTVISKYKRERLWSIKHKPLDVWHRLITWQSISMIRSGDKRKRLFDSIQLDSDEFQAWMEKKKEKWDETRRLVRSGIVIGKAFDEIWILRHVVSSPRTKTRATRHCLRKIESFPIKHNQRSTEDSSFQGPKTMKKHEKAITLKRMWVLIRRRI